MTQLQIEGKGGSSTIYLDSDFERLAECMGGRKTVIITDENVFRLHGEAFPTAADVVVVSSGEVSKTLTSAEAVFRRLVAAELDRSSLIVGIGGGVVTDLTGFAACTFMRGVAFGFVATTVLAQVDAAIGGKNGVNLDGFKNLIGIIRQPEFVINHTAMLGTLPAEERINGMSEIIKSGCIADRELVGMLEAAAGAEDPYGAVNMGEAVSRAAAVKVGVVNRDVFEKGERRHLNFGHTLGHAVEKVAKLPHGFAVAVGMVAAAKISARRGMLREADVRRVEALIAAYGLPTQMELDLGDAMDAIRKDKKRQSDTVNFVLLNAIGGAVVEPISFLELEEVLRDLR